MRSLSPCVARRRAGEELRLIDQALLWVLVDDTEFKVNDLDLKIQVRC